MSLHLDLSLKAQQVLLGGEVALCTTLRNDADTPIETASLFDNSQVTNYVLSDSQDKVVATVNNITRQILMEKGEPRTGDVRLISLGAGQAEIREDNLCLYHWFERPGVFHLRVLYRWREQSILSAPQRLEIMPAPLRWYDQQWAYHYGEKFMLHACWLAERQDSRTELFLRESLRFRPQVINHNPSLGIFAPTVAPRVSFDRTLVAGGSIWLAWLGEGEVTALRTYGGKPTSAVRTHAVPLVGLDWAAPPLRSENDDVILLVSGVEPGAGRRVMAIELGPDGGEVRRAMVTPALAGAVIIQGVCDEDLGFHLFWLTGDTHEIRHQPIDLAALASAGPPKTLWQAPSLLLGFFTPPVLMPDSFFSCAFTVPDDRALRLGLAWLQLVPQANPLKLQEIALPGPDAVLRVSGEMNQSGHLFAMVTTPKAVHYVNGFLMQSRTLAATADLFPDGAIGLTVNHRDDVFFTSNRRPFGLAESLIHSGADEDITEKDDDDLAS